MLVVAQETKHGFKKGQCYTVQTDDKTAVFRTEKGRKALFIPMSLLGKLNLKAINDTYN